VSALVSSVRGYVASKGVEGIARDAGFVALAISPLWLCRNASIGTPLKVAFCVGVACVLASFDRALWQQLTERPVLRRSVALALGLGVAWFLLRKSLAARWWLIDDHEIADALVVGEVGTLKGLWHTLVTHREIGSPPWSYPRYRPSYYTLRYIESYLWGFDASRWYLMRLLLLAVSFALSWQTLLLVTGPAQASLTLLFMLSAPFWADVFCRLGPSEQYALLGCALFVYGASASLRAINAGRTPLLRHWGLAVLGSVIAGGSKENFVFIPGLLALLTGVAAYRRKLSKHAVWMSALALLYAGWVVLVVIVSVRRHGATVYGTDASLGSAPELAFDAVSELFDTYSSVMLLALAGAFACFIYHRTPGFLRRLVALGIGLALCAGVYGLQAIVYKGQIATETRYAFPAAVIGALIVSLLFAFLRWEARASELPTALHAAIDAAVLAAATYLVASVGFQDLKEVAAQNVARTQVFSQAVAEVAEKLRAQPTRPLLFSVGRPDDDLEPLVSLRIFLEYYGVTNPMFVAVAPEAQGRMEATVRSWSLDGLADWQTDEGLHGERKNPRKFLPLRELPTRGPAFGIALSQTPPAGVEQLPIRW
jgi:hypothetical protein